MASLCFVLIGPPRAAASAELTYWEVDGIALSNQEAAAGRDAAARRFEEVKQRCGTATGRDSWVSCALRVFSEETRDPSEPVSWKGVETSVAESTVSRVLLTGQGSCAGLAGAVLLLAGPEPDLDALVVPDHVTLRSRKTGRVLELLEGGRVLLPVEEKTRLKGAEVVTAKDFPSYYADNLAVRLAGTGRFDVAEELFRKALDANPTSRRIRFNFGTFLLDRGRPREALPHLEAAARGRQGLGEADLNRGVALSKLGRTAEAEKAFRRCLRRDPENLMAKENLRRLVAGGSEPTQRVPP